MYYLQITPQLRHRMNLNLTEMCLKHQVGVGSYRHCMWSCIHIEEYWGKIVDKLNLIFNVHLETDPQVFLLVLPSPQYSYICCP